MQSKAKTVAEYIAELPEERRATLSAVRAVIKKRLDRDFEEGMQYGMIGYYVPHRLFPAGYHCDPKQPLPFAALAAQKNYFSVYVMGLYIDSADGVSDGKLAREFRAAWERTGRKLDMGKCCVRFKKLEDVALDVLGDTLEKFTVRRYIELYQTALDSRSRGSRPAGKSGAANDAKGAARKSAAKPSRKAKA
ncbi:MAG: DUF1801 domain-containing protein [Planctomycetes bacterium]|nr:DUF1801 domain-containing protein [Planctomycetota bacterium]